MNTNNQDDIEYSCINRIDFSILSPEQIKKMSVVNITKSQLYDSNGEPTIKGLFDTAMGVIVPRKRCRTCKNTFIECPGHFGHIELVKPVFNIQFDNYIMKILKCICPKCNKLLVNKNHPKVLNIIKNTKDNNKDRFEKMFNLISKIKHCGNPNNKEDLLYNPNGCGTIRPSKYINNIKSSSCIELEWNMESSDGESVTHKYNAEIILSLFKRISEEDALVLGFSPKWCMPSWLIISVLPVVPPCARPSVRQYNNQRSEDDLTHKYNDIIKNNEMFKNNLSSNNIQHFMEVIQYHVSTLINNDVKGIPPAQTRGGRPMKTLSERLKSKEGRIRHNLMGKRVDYSARSVISPDANLNIEQLGVPKKIAMNLTFPEVVNKFNINKMYKLIKNGNKVYPGAKSITDRYGNTRLLEYRNTDNLVLEYGDIVNRHLIDGDYVLFNRQPSLHKMSMMAHQVKVMEGNTFRFNVDVCKPYNADFDGDEMNMHVPQSVHTAIEIKYLAEVPKHIIDPSDNKPIICPSQDNLLGLFKITDEGVYFTQQEVMNILMTVSKFDGNLPEPDYIKGNKIRWTGKQLYSIVLPSINLKKKKSDGIDIIIVNGILIQGQISKSESVEIVSIIHSDYGYKEAQRYLNDLQKVIVKYMIRSGYSIGINDMIVHNDIKVNNKNIIVECKKEVNDITKKMHLNILENIKEGLDTVYEAKVKGLLGECRDKIINNNIKMLDKNNKVKYMVDSGSKGSVTNIQQMLYLLDQQTIDGQRVPLGFSNRSLPHYPKYENGVESRGFIANNYIDGLNPQEFFFHAMAGREGLIDTAVKTASSGYLQRRLVKATEDLKVNHDGTVRSSNNDIVEFIYGDDGFDSSALKKQNSSFIKINYETLMNNYIISDEEAFKNYINSKTLSKMMKDSNLVKDIEKYNNQVKECIVLIYDEYMKFVDKIEELRLYYPINFKKMIENTINKFGDSFKSKSDLDVLTVIRSIDELIDYCSMNGHINKTLVVLLHDYLSPKKIIRDLKFNKLAFEFIVNYIKMIFNESLVESGEMVGPLAAQSIGSKSTQLTLNTFHLAGVGEKSNVTRGVPRLHELLSNTKNPKQPSNIIYLTDNVKYDKSLADKIGNNIESATIGDIIISDAIYLEPQNNFENVLPEDKDVIEIYKIFSELNNQFEQISNNPWVIRLEFDKRKIIDKKITMEDIYIVLKNKYPTSILIYYDDNANKLIFRLRMTNVKINYDQVDDDIILLKNKINEIKSTIIKGVNNIKKVYRPIENTIYVKEGDVYTEKTEYYLNTDGANLFDILLKKNVDTYRTYSIYPNEMNMVFGIEAARMIIEDQLKEVLEGSDVKINPRHLSLLCDKMTRGGDFMSIDRHGINKENIGPLAKSSFEETTDQLQEASLFGVRDNIKGVSSNIMVGQVAACGTGDSTLLIDEELLLKAIELKNSDSDSEDVSYMFESSPFCDQNSDIKFNINSVVTDHIELNNIPEVDIE